MRRQTLLTALTIVVSLSTASAAGAQAAPSVRSAAPSRAEAAPAAPGDIQVSFGTHNVLHGKGDFRPFAGVIGWQEVDSPAARDKLRRSLPGYQHFFPKAGPAKSVPISWRADRFELVKSGNVRTHGGEAGVTPARYINWVILRQPGQNKRFIVLNTHFISGAWTKHPERRPRWRTHARKLRHLVGELGDEHPRAPIFAIGDFNRRRPVDLPHEVTYIRVAGVRGVPIDQCYATRSIGNSKAERLGKNGSDHFTYRFTGTF
jgi:hypothetical protein